MKRPDTGFGMRHVALFVHDLEACVSFYTSLMGMEVEWRPDEQNAYLTSGSDNLALHQASTDHPSPSCRRLGTDARHQLIDRSDSPLSYSHSMEVLKAPSSYSSKLRYAGGSVSSTI